jgi:hypothetical protein
MSDKELRAFHDRCAERAQAHQALHARVKDELEGRSQKRGKASRTARKPATRRPSARKAA